VQARYTLRDYGKLDVFNTLMNPLTVNVDSAKAVGKCNYAHCKIKFFLFYNGDYRLVSTDYDNYSVVYS
jgi:lipocalin